MAEKKIAIIANGVAGAGAARVHAFSARSKLWGYETVFVYPKSITELREFFLNVDPKNYGAVIPIGGDGTLNQVLRCLKERPNAVPVFPFPGGTANDFAKELGLSSDWNQVQTLLDRKKTDLIDLIEVNGVPFATVGGIGIGSLLTDEYNRMRVTSPIVRGLASRMSFEFYSLLSAKTVLFNRSYVQRLHFQSAGFNEKMKTSAVFLCNQTYLGGNMKVAPRIDNNDQRFNVMIVNACSRVKLLRALTQLKSGTIPKEFFVFSTDHLVVTSESGKPIRAFGDGEILADSHRLEFHIRPKSLRVFRDQVRSYS